MYGIIMVIPIKVWKDRSTQEGFSWCIPLPSLLSQAFEKSHVKAFATVAESIGCTDWTELQQVI